MKSWWFLKIIKGLLFFTVFILAFGFIVMALWNAILPEIFDIGTITFLQAVGLLVLSKIFFGFGNWGGRPEWRHRGGSWRKRMEAKMAGMTPEERAKFKEMYYQRCGHHYKEKDFNEGDEPSAAEAAI